MTERPITSECPNCGQERLQDGYERAELVQLLRSGAAIPGYCATCDEQWELSVEERADLARSLNE